VVQTRQSREDEVEVAKSRFLQVGQAGRALELH